MVLTGWRAARKARATTRRAARAVARESSKSSWTWGETAGAAEGEMFLFDVSDVRYAFADFSLLCSPENFHGRVRINVQDILHMLDEETDEQHREDLVIHEDEAALFDANDRSAIESEINNLWFTRVRRQMVRLEAAAVTKELIAQPIEERPCLKSSEDTRPSPSTSHACRRANMEA